MICSCGKKMQETKYIYFCSFCLSWNKKENITNEILNKKIYFNVDHAAFKTKEVIYVINIFNKKGFNISLKDAYLAWIFYSEMFGKRWATTDKGEDEIFNIIFGFLSLKNKQKISLKESKNENTNNKNK